MYKITNFFTRSTTLPNETESKRKAPAIPIPELHKGPEPDPTESLAYQSIKPISQKKLTGLKKIRDTIIEANSLCLNKFRHLVFKTEFKYGHLIDRVSNSSSWTSPMTSRITTLGISLASLIALIQDIQHALCHTLNGIIFTVTKLKSPMQYSSSYREVILVAADIGKHILGVCFGSIIGLVSPEKARTWFLPSDQSHMETREKNMSKEQAGHLYGMLQLVDNLFDSHGIKYAITAGTVLGKERHGGIIPWDDDVDLFMMEEDKQKLLDLKDTLEQFGLGLIECHFGYKIYYLKGDPVPEDGLNYNFPFIDIGLVKQDGNIITYIDPINKNRYAGEYYTPEEWNHITKVPFGPIQVSGLKDGSAFVARCYGIGAMEYGFNLLNHRTFGLEIPKKYYMHRNAQTGSSKAVCKPIEYDEAIFKSWQPSKGQGTHYFV